MEINKIDVAHPKYKTNSPLDIIPGDFWLNSFADYLNVGGDVLGGSGLYRFLVPLLLVNKLEGEEKNKMSYDYVLIDLPPSFNTLVRSALYCSDYFIVPCTSDLFSAYCIGLIGEVLPRFVKDWEQGEKRFIEANPYDSLIKSKGKPKFGGWIFNGFDTRNGKKLGADQYQYDAIVKKIENKLFPDLRKVKNDKDYECLPSFVKIEPIVQIEDLNVAAPDSIAQNVPIKYLSEEGSTRKDMKPRSWTEGQINSIKKADQGYDYLADYIIKNFC
jgi:cellulose biosynthesis protein BcsQ